jgi:hypothetical protein
LEKTRSVWVYRPTKGATQSGPLQKPWVLEFVSETPKERDPLMGWIGSKDPLAGQKLFFETQEEAISFAHNKGYVLIFRAEHLKKRVPKSYGDTFLKLRELV